MMWMLVGMALADTKCSEVAAGELGDGEVGICVDLRGGAPMVDTTFSDLPYLPPNRRVMVLVDVCQNETATVTLGGAGGLTEAAIASVQASATGTQTIRAADPTTCGAVPTRQILRFSPRKPGTAVTLKVTASKPALTDVTIADFTVAQPYGGAVRVGVGVGTVVDASYSAVTAPGSSTPEIIATAEGRWAPELVIGFAPFLDKGGRIYEAPRVARFAPFLGLGAVGTGANNETTLSVLKSVYLGGEIEFMRHSSLALTAQLRRVSRLADPYDVGGPYSGSAAVPTVSSYQLGGALIFNVSPEFLEFAKKPLDTGKK